MMVVEKTGKTVDEAIEMALQELQVKKEQVEIKVIDEPNKGFFGFIGNKLAKVRVQIKENVAVVEREINKKNDYVKKEKQVLTNEDSVNEAKKLLNDVFRTMKIEVQLEVLKREEYVHINLVGPDLGLLIGRRGDTLDALQYLINLAVNRNKETRTRFVLDVEGYRNRREKTLQNLAIRLADKAKRKGQDVVLEPMNPHERRIIHTALQDDVGVGTRSEGEEPYRKIVITPKR